MPLHGGFWGGLGYIRFTAPTARGRGASPPGAAVYIAPDLYAPALIPVAHRRAGQAALSADQRNAGGTALNGRSEDWAPDREAGHPDRSNPDPGSPHPPQASTRRGENGEAPAPPPRTPERHLKLPRCPAPAPRSASWDCPAVPLRAGRGRHCPLTAPQGGEGDNGHDTDGQLRLAAQHSRRAGCFHSAPAAPRSPLGTAPSGRPRTPGRRRPQGNPGAEAAARFGPALAEPRTCCATFTAWQRT